MPWSMANFEAFRPNFSSSTNSEIGRSEDGGLPTSKTVQYSTLLHNNHGKPNSQVTGEILYFDECTTIITIHSQYVFTILINIIRRCVFTGTGQALFDHIASCLSDFVHDRKIENEILPLGFTFSFPCQQQGLAKAKYQWC